MGTMRFKTIGRGISFLMAAGTLIIGLSLGPAAAQETADTPDELTETYGSWTLRCGSEATRCHVTQSLFRAKDNARLIQVTLFSSPEANGVLLMRALTPLGSVLKNGAAMIIDETKPENAPYLSCWPRGCISELKLTVGLVAALRAGQVLAVQSSSATTGQTIRFELTLDGISAALNRLKEM